MLLQNQQISIDDILLKRLDQFPNRGLYMLLKYLDKKIFSSFLDE